MHEPQKIYKQDFLLHLFLGYSKSSLKYFGFTIGSVLGGWIISAIIVAVIGFVLDLTNKTMSWYANPWLLVGIYMLPVVGLSGMLLNFISHEVITVFRMNLLSVDL